VFPVSVVVVGAAVLAAVCRCEGHARTVLVCGEVSWGYTYHHRRPGSHRARAAAARRHTHCSLELAMFE